MSGNVTRITNFPITLVGAGNITTSPFFGYLWIYIGSLSNPVISGQQITFGTVTASTGNILNLTPVVLSSPLFRGTNYIVNLAFPSSVSSTGLGSILASPTFNDIPSTTLNISLLRNITLPTPPGGNGYFATSPPSFNPNCLHGSSLIHMKEGTKRIDKIQSGDIVISDDKYAKVETVSTCWLTFMGTDHDAIIFEKDSLGVNEPYKQLIIDPGHPMCTKQEYEEKGYEALRPAGSYWEELKCDKIYTKKWTDILEHDEPSVRYDLILEEPFNTYIANGMVVQSKGYKDHRYKEFV